MPTTKVPRLDPSVNRKIRDAALRHAHLLEQYKQAQVNATLTFLNRQVLPDILQKVRSRLQRNMPGKVTTQRLKELSNSVDELLRDGMKQASKEVQAELQDFARTEAEWQRRLLETQASDYVEVDFTTPPVNQLDSILSSRPMNGAVMKDWFSTIALRGQQEIIRQLNIGQAAGETVDQLVERIQGSKVAKYTNGVFGRIRRNVESTVRTAVAHVSNATRDDTYDENNDVIQGVMIVATLDNRTTPMCRAQDGRVYPVGQGWRPPGHWNCRTTTVPVLKSWEELGIDLNEAPEGTRAAMNGQVPEAITYEDWLAAQPEDVQDEVLGTTRADLFRSGKITIDQFVDDKGRQLTLEELARQEGLNTEEAGLSPVVDETTPTDFVLARDKLTPELKAFLTPYSPDEYLGKETSLYLSPNQKSGFGVNPDGELISVFSLEKGRGPSLAKQAVLHGAKRLDCIGPKLVSLYKTVGFRVVDQIPWDDKYAPPNWNYDRFGTPDIYIMERT